MRSYEWSIIKPMLPNRPRGIPRVDDRRIQRHLLGLERDLPDSFGPPTTCYNRFAPGGGLAFGTGLWMRWLPFMMRRSK